MSIYCLKRFELLWRLSSFSFECFVAVFTRFMSVYWILYYSQLIYDFNFMLQYSAISCYYSTPSPHHSSFASYSF